MSHPTRTQSTTHLSTASTVLSHSSSSDDTSPLSSAIQIASHLSDIGKSLPFLAPAFVLLKILIDIEQRAQEVDAKCTDIMDRITFMLSHLTVLEDLELVRIQESTKKVVERINEVMKGAVALVSAYRKQNKVARRLSLGNRERFMQCAEGINVCCRDLLLSLQIHQSKQLEILLRREVPIDEEDEAARTFVDEKSAGSMEGLLHDRELVKEYAEQRCWVMDDEVMGQLNANIADSMEQTRMRLEEVLKANLSTAVVDGFKDLFVQLSLSLSSSSSSQEQEQTLTCVQCESLYTNSSNHPLACTFHKAEYDSWNRSTPYACCSTPHPCSTGPHRSKHHCDYAYSTFFKRARGVDWYTDTCEVLGSVLDKSLDDGDDGGGGGSQEASASVSRLLRWSTRGERLQEPTLLVKVGRCWWTENYFWGTWTGKELEDVARSVRVSKRTLIFKSMKSKIKKKGSKEEEEEEEYASASWILSISGKITGIIISAKSRTSSAPYTRIIPLDLSMCTKTGDTIRVSDGGMTSYMPEGPKGYGVYKDMHEEKMGMVRYGPTLREGQVRKERVNFRTRVSGPGAGPGVKQVKLVMKAVDDPPLTANPDLASTEYDYFVGKVSLFNNNAVSSVPMTISSVRAEWRVVPPPASPLSPAPLSPATPAPSPYTPLPSSAFKLLPSSTTILPLTLPPLQSTLLHFQISIPRSEADKKLQVRWWNRAFGRDVRRGAGRVRVVCVVEGRAEDGAGEGGGEEEEEEETEASLVLEYVWTSPRLEKWLDSESENDAEGSEGENEGWGWELQKTFGFDNPVLWERYIVKCEPGDPLSEIFCHAWTGTSASSTSTSTSKNTEIVNDIDPTTLSTKVVLKLGGSEITVNRLQQLVYRALKPKSNSKSISSNSQTEINLGIGRDHNTGAGSKWAEDGEGGLGGGSWYWDTWGLVDRECSRVYAVKVVVRLGVRDSDTGEDAETEKDAGSKQEETAKGYGYGFGCVGYILIPPYGSIVPSHIETRPARLADEVVRLPRVSEEMERRWRDEFRFDQEAAKGASDPEGSGDLEKVSVGLLPLLEDGLDDWKPIVPPKPRSTPSVPPPVSSLPQPQISQSQQVQQVQWNISPELSSRLESIDRSLARIADVLERLLPVGGGVQPGGARRDERQDQTDGDAYGGVLDEYSNANAGVGVGTTRNGYVD